MSCLGLLLLWGGTANGQPTYPVSDNDANLPLPLITRPETGGFYGALEFVFLKQTRSIGSQTVAVRGLYDTIGSITVSDPDANQQVGFTPGRFYGSGAEALNTDDIGRTTFQPGFNLTVGYKFESGTAFSFSYMNLADAHYSAGATFAPPNQNAGAGAFDSFLTSNVFNFSNQYNGPILDTALDFSGTFLSPITGDVIPITSEFAPRTPGIWNAADIMDIKFLQRYTQAEIVGRTPVYDNDWSRSYVLGGAKFAWFFERFLWRTTDLDIDGNTSDINGPYAAEYSNTLSQRMYGPLLGCGHEVYIGEKFALSADVTAAALINIMRKRAKYERVDETTQAKRSQNDFSLVPNVNAGLNLWWYPYQGVQIRAGYQLMTYFNTERMEAPIGFDFGRIDPGYGDGYFRYLHGFNIGIGLAF